MEIVQIFKYFCVCVLLIIFLTAVDRHSTKFTFKYLPININGLVRKNRANYDNFQFDALNENQINEIFFNHPFLLFSKKTHFLKTEIPMNKFGKCFHLINSSANDIWNEDAKIYFLNSQLPYYKEELNCRTQTPLESDGNLFIREKHTSNSQFYLANRTRWNLVKNIFGENLSCFLIGIEDPDKILDLRYKKGALFHDRNIWEISIESFSIQCREDTQFGKILMEMKKKKFQPNDTKTPNIIILGIDSISSQQFERSLPKSLSYLNTHAVNFKYSMIIGENTFPNFVGLLTGMLSDKIENISIAGYKQYNGDLPLFLSEYDNLPFLWKYLPDNYVTYKQEDYAKVGMFNYLRPGFKEKPVDINFRDYYQSYENIKKICNNARHFYDKINRFIKRMTSNKLPFLMVTSFNKYTHNDITLSGLIDKELLHTLKLIDKNYGKNSIIIVYGDHGARLHSYGYKSSSGIMERKKSSFFIRLPKLFQEEYPIKFERFSNNSQRIVTPIDIHFTLLEILSLNFKKDLLKQRESLIKSLYGSNKSLEELRIEFNWRYTANKDMSLLSHKLPYDRSCVDANINMDNCLCNSRYRKFELKEKVKTLHQHFTLEDKNRLNNLVDVINKNLIVPSRWENCQNNSIHSIQHYTQLIYYTNQLFFTNDWYEQHNNRIFLKRFDTVTIIFFGLRKSRYQTVCLIEEWSSSKGKYMNETDRQALFEHVSHKLKKNEKVAGGMIHKNNSYISYFKYIVVSITLNDFDEAAAVVKKLKSQPTDEDQLELYGYYKQVNVGNVNIDRPGMLKMRERAKWDAWNS
ncbi:hypothetical protein SNEBB_001040, partial [Seison nebaliae]